MGLHIVAVHGLVGGAKVFVVVVVVTETKVDLSSVVLLSPGLHFQRSVFYSYL